MNAKYHTNFQDRRIASPPHHYIMREYHSAVLAKIQASYDMTVLVVLLGPIPCQE